MYSRRYGKNVAMYDFMLNELGSLLEPAILQVHPDDYGNVKQGLHEARKRNGYWPDIVLERNEYLAKGVIVWMRTPLPIPSPSTLPKPNL